MSSPPPFFLGWTTFQKTKNKTKFEPPTNTSYCLCGMKWHPLLVFLKVICWIFSHPRGKKTTNTLLSFFWSSDSHQNGIGIDLPISRTFGVFKSFEQISEIGSFPQVRVKITHIFLTFWNHHLVMFLVSTTNTLGIQSYSQIMIGMFNHLSIVFRFHYHSQEVIGSLGIDTSWLTFFFETK